jgi:magnesium chelatase family protein
MRIEVPRVPVDELVQAAVDGNADAAKPSSAEPRSAEMADPAAHVLAARERRLAASGVLSARLSAAQLKVCCALSGSGERLLRSSCQQLGLSGRGVHRVLLLGRTIADLAGSERIEPAHLAEAIQLRR